MPCIGLGQGEREEEEKEEIMELITKLLHWSNEATLWGWVVMIYPLHSLKKKKQGKKQTNFTLIKEKKEAVV